MARRFTHGWICLFGATRPESTPTRRRRRGRPVLAVVLVFALVATLGGAQALPQQPRDPGDKTAASAGEDGFRSWLRDVARGLVGGGGPAVGRPEPVLAGLAVDQRPPRGVRTKPATRVRELTGRRSATTRVFAMSDGRLQAEVSAAPRFYRDGKGGWQPINTTVSASTTGGFAAANTTNTFVSRFGASTASLARFELDGQTVSLGLAGPSRRVTPTVEGDTVTYAGVAEGVDLSYEVTATALKERMVLRGPSAASSLSFSLDAGALRVAQRGDGLIEFRSPVDGRVLLVMPAPFMLDSHAEATSPYGYAYSPKVSQVLRADGGRWAIDVTADKGWLADPKRKYPVIVDPTITIQPATGQGKDAMVESDLPNQPFGSLWRLSVGTTSGGAARGLVQFDLSSIPANTTLDSASLQMYYDQTHTTNAYDVPVEVREVTKAWDEATVTWNAINTSMGAGAATVVQVDDVDTDKIAMVGAWPNSTSTLARDGINGTYRFNKDTVAGDTFTWVPALPEDGTYTVEEHHVPASDRSTAAEFTVTYDGGTKLTKVNQQQPANADWATLGTFPFTAGTVGRVKLGDATVTNNVAVIADAVRFTKAGGVKRAGEANVWHTFPATNLVQKWLNNPATNFGFMLKAVDEVRLAHGGPRYEAAEDAYNGETENAPKLIVNYGNPGVVVQTPRTVFPTGAALRWSAYAGSDIAEYQVHRSTSPNFTPSAATLVAPVAKTALSYQDTTATPTPASSPDPFGQVYYYQVAVKTTNGTVVPSTAVVARLPKSGQVVTTIQASADATISSTQPTTNLNTLGGRPLLNVGNNSVDYGFARALLRFDTSTIPTDARVLSTSLNLWSSGTIFGTSQQSNYNVHALTKPFDPATATWQKATAATTWDAAGGDLTPTVAGTLGNFDVDDPPQWRRFTLDSTIQNWINGTAPNNGLLVKHADEGGRLKENTMYLATEATEPLRPQLHVVYTQPDAIQTYYAPTTPAVMTSDGTYSIPVTVSNPTTATFTTADWVLSYRWALPDGTPVPTAGASLQTILPADIPPAAAVDVTAQVKAPAASTDGNQRTDYTLNWELFNKTTGQWLSQTTTPIAALPQNIAVEEPTSDQLGLEKFYAYAGKNTGAGSTVMGNLYAGNAVWSYNAFTNPSRGLSTFVRLANNSLDTSDTVTGYGWSLQASSLMRLGTPLDFHPNPNPTTVTLTDGDGTSHQFTWDAGAGQWISPKGVHLYLEKVTSLDCKPNTEEPKAWRMTRPDRTQFFYDCDGYLTSTSDNNGNEMTFTYEERRSNNKPTKFLKYLTDPAGRPTLTLDYWAKGDTYDYIDDTTWNKVSGVANLTNPHIIDHVRSITDISGRTLTFTYTDKGLLGELIDGAGSTNGAPKVFAFRYDMTQGNKNVKLVQVTDPRGHATGLDYYSRPEDDPKFKWRLKTITDRLGSITADPDDYTTRYAYTDPDGPQGSTIHTTVTDAENHTTLYKMDGFGRPVETTNAKNEITKLQWDDQHNVERLEEANGAVSTREYDPKTGYPTLIKDAEAVANGWTGTVLAYQRQLNGYVADLTAKTSSEGHRWTFTYTTEGDLASVTDPIGNTTTDPDDYTTRYTYDTGGQVRTTTDANGHTTKYDDYDPSGSPQTITDARNDPPTTYTYDERGNVLTVTDARQHTSSYTYDVFGRPGDASRGAAGFVSKIPKDQAAGQFIITPAPNYDPNDNVTVSIAPNGAQTTASYDDADHLSASLAPRDTVTGPERKTSYRYDKVGNVLSVTEPNGNLTPTDPNDYSTRYTYDEIYQTTTMTDGRGGLTTYSYDNVGNLTKTVDPNKNATANPDDFTTKYTYDLNHQPRTTTDAAGFTASVDYDRDGLPIVTTDEEGNKTLLSYDARGMLKESKAPHDTVDGTIVYHTTQYDYDQVGNRTKVISPRGVETTDDDEDFTQVTVYDELNRVTEQILPWDKDDRYVNQPTDTIINTYDEVGNLTKVSRPPSGSKIPGVDVSNVRVDTTYTYFDNGWVATSTDPFGVVDSYDYDALGGQSHRTITGADGGLSRDITWTYYPDGKLQTKDDEGFPWHSELALLDNSDLAPAARTEGPLPWTRSTAGTGFLGYDYSTHAPGTGANSTVWTANVVQDGDYEVFVRIPAVDGAATNATYNLFGQTKTVDQREHGGEWVSLGTYHLPAKGSAEVRLTDAADGPVLADAIKFVRQVDASAEPDNEFHRYAYTYDPNGNLADLHDNSDIANVAEWVMTYNPVNQVATLEERLALGGNHTSTYDYYPNGTLKKRTYDGRYDSFEYNPVDQVSKVTNGESPGDLEPDETTYTYTPRGQVKLETRGVGNTVDHTYYADGLLRHLIQKGGAFDQSTVAEHTLTYDANGNGLTDQARLMNADNNGNVLSRDKVYTYDPRDRVATVGDGTTTEGYSYDANNNVLGEVLTNASVPGNEFIFNAYDRNRLVESLDQKPDNDSTSDFFYDSLGRLSTIKSDATVKGQAVQGQTRYSYDGFSRKWIVNRDSTGQPTQSTVYQWDSLDRLRQAFALADNPDGTTKENKVFYRYLGASDLVLSEDRKEIGPTGETTNEQLTTYRYGVDGTRLSQDTQTSDGGEAEYNYSIDPRGNVEAITIPSGQTAATYGYTAHGRDITDLYTGVDKPNSDPNAPPKTPVNVYRFAAQQFDQASGIYNVGFRDYSPAVTSFLTPDHYSEAQADLRLGPVPVDIATPNSPSIGDWLKDQGRAFIDHIKEDPWQFAGELAIGAAAAIAVGLVCSTGIGCVILAGVAAGAAGAGYGYGVDVAQGEHDFNTGDFIKTTVISAAVGGLTAGIGYGIGRGISRLLGTGEGAAGAEGALPGKLLRSAGRGKAYERAAARISPMKMSQVRPIAAKYGISLKGLKISVNDKWSYRGVTGPDQSISLGRGAFENEEQMVKTLIHEFVHVRDLRRGVPYPETPYNDLAPSPDELRAELVANRWWEIFGKFRK